MHVYVNACLYILYMTVYSFINIVCISNVIHLLTPVKIPNRTSIKGGNIYLGLSAWEASFNSDLFLTLWDQWQVELSGIKTCLVKAATLIMCRNQNRSQERADQNRFKSSGIPSEGNAHFQDASAMI